MIETIRPFAPRVTHEVLRLRLLLARLLSLRWTRVRGVDAAIPLGLAAIAAGLWDRLWRPLGPVPWGVVWLVVVAGALAAAFTAQRLRLIGRVRPVALLVVPAVAGWGLFDVQLWQQTNHLYDLDVYLAAAGRWLDGGQPYMTRTISAWPSSAAADYFLYPPPLLPFFGLLSRLPNPAVSAAWVVLLALCAFAAFRALGLGPAWSAAFVFFPPVMVGIESGNVASITFLLFALGFRAGGGLVLNGLFKVQTAIPALWLVRQRRWRPLAVGVLAALAIVAVSVLLMGSDIWFDWWAGLGYRASSQPAVTYLYGNSMAAFMPGILFVAVSAVLILAALAFSRRRSLAGLGLASLFASPALWPHGFAFALPAVLMLESGVAVWILLGAAALDPNYWFLFYAGWLALLAGRGVVDAAHPMAGTGGPWARRRVEAVQRAEAVQGAEASRGSGVS